MVDRLDKGKTESRAEKARRVEGLQIGRLPCVKNNTTKTDLDK